MEKAHIKVLPGRYLSRDTEQGNPGETMCGWRGR